MKTQRPKYLDEVIKRGLAEPLGPGLSEIAVYHDDWCDLLKGKGPCNCEPEVAKPKPLKVRK